MNARDDRYGPKPAVVSFVIYDRYAPDNGRNQRKNGHQRLYVR